MSCVVARSRVPTPESFRRSQCVFARGGVGGGRSKHFVGISLAGCRIGESLFVERVEGGRWDRPGDEE